VAVSAAVEHRRTWQLRAGDEERRVKGRESSPSSPMVSVASGNCERWQQGEMAAAGDCDDTDGDTRRAQLGVGIKTND
jgi:hypothetical protein